MSDVMFSKSEGKTWKTGFLPPSVQVYPGEASRIEEMMSESLLLTESIGKVILYPKLL